MIPLPPFRTDDQTSKSVPIPAIARKAQERLERSSYLALREVSCFASEGDLHLFGCLPSQYLKQLAQETALSVEGACRVINRIIVLAPGSRGGQGRESPAPSQVCVDKPHPWWGGSSSPNTSETKGVDNHVGTESQAE